MTRGQIVTVYPLDKGARQVTIGMRLMGGARSREDLRRFLRREGLPEDVDDPKLIDWRGGGSRTWEIPGTGPGDAGSKRTFTAVGLVFGLFVNAAILGYIGATDVGDALSYAGRLAGASLLLVAFVAFASAFAIVLEYGLGFRFNFSAATALFGVLAVLATNFMMLLMAAFGGEYTNRFLLWGSLFAWSVWAVWELVYRQWVWGRIRHRRKFVAALSIGAIVAIFNFANSHIYQPYASPVTVTVAAKLGKPLRGTDYTYLPLTLRFKNTGKMGAHLIGAAYRIYGVKDSVKALENPDTAELLWNGTLVDPGYYWLEPGEEVTHERIIPVSSGYVTVKARADAVVLRKDRAKLDKDVGAWKSSKEEQPPPWVQEFASSSNIRSHHLPISLSNEILDMTRNNQYITLWWINPINAEGTALLATVAPEGGEKERPDNSEVLGDQDRYGLIGVQSGWAEMPL